MGAPNLGPIRRGTAALARRLPSRRLTITVVVALPIAGAAIGAGTHAQPVSRYGAAAAIVVDLNSGGTTEAAAQLRRAELVARAAGLPEVLAAARTMVASRRSNDEIAERVGVDFVPGSSLVRIKAREDSEPQALALANAVALQAFSFARRIGLTRAGSTVLGDFEDPVSEWGATQSLFNTPPRALRHVTRGAKFGSGSLRIECPATPACGPVVQVSQHFRRRVTYVATGWAKTPNAADVSMVLGDSPRDVNTGTPRRLGPGWRRLTVSWTPTGDSTSAELGFRTSSTDAAVFEIDGVRLLDPAGLSAEALEVSRSSDARAFADARFATVSPARTTGSSESRGLTVRWAIIGALAGLAIVLPALGSGAAARRVRRRDST